MKNRKYTNLLLFALSLFIAVSCGKFDDSALWQAINKHTEEIAALKEKCNTLNSDIESLRRIIDALQSRDYITACTPLADGSGYTIVFYLGQSIVIKNGADGKDGATPEIGIAQFTDGLYYWTLDGEWLLDKEGNMIRADGKDGEDGKDGQDGEDGKDGITPKLKIEDGDWYISTDNGATWTNLGRATGEDGKDGQDAQSLFKSVTPEDDCVIFVLNDGTELRVPYYSEGKNIAITGEYSDLTAYSVILHGWSHQEGEEGHSAIYGIEYSDSDLSTARSTIIAETRDQENKYCCSLTQLHPNTKYYYRAFTYFDEYFYGEVQTFTTLDGPDMPEYPSMTLDPANLVFEETASSYCIQVTCNRDWMVSALTVPDWISLTVDGKDIIGVAQEASPYPVTVTVTVLANEGTDRSASILFNGGSLAKKTLTIKQSGNASYTTIAEVRALNPDKGAKVNAPEGTVIKGVVISDAKLKNLNSQALVYVQDATAGIFIKCSANHSFAFGDEVLVDLSGVSLEYYYNLFQANGVALDKVSVLSSGKTPEVVQVSVADFLAGKYESRYIELNEDVQVVDADLSKNWGNMDRHTSINIETKSGSKFIVQSSSYSSYKDTKVSQGSGKIKGIASVYDDKIQLVFAQLSDFAGLIGERFAAAVVPKPETEKISEVVAASDGTEITLKNVTVVAASITTEKDTFMVEDADHAKLLVFGAALGTIGEGAINIGDVVTVRGIRSAYFRTPQLSDPTVTKTGTGSISYPSAKDISSELDTSKPKVGDYVKFTGKLNIDGNYYNVSVDGATTVIGAFNKPKFIDVTSYNDVSNVTYTGYYLYHTSNGKYLYIIVTDVQASDAPYLSVSPETISVKSSDTSVQFKVSSNIESWTCKASTGAKGS